MAMHNQPHPGEFIAEVYLKPNAISGRELATKLGVAASIGVTTTTFGGNSAVHGLQLLQTAAIVPFTVTEETTVPGADEGEFGLQVQLVLADEEDPDIDPADVVEWGAFGFVFAIAALSFGDARPRGASDVDYVADDELSVGNLVAELRFRQGELHYDADYVRGRRMKTRVVVRPNGSATIETRGRGKSALTWLSRLAGRKPVQAVK